MSITFKSSASADVVMYDEHANRILDLFHKDASRGVFSAAETANAVAVLEKEIAQDRVRSTAAAVRRDVTADDGAAGEGDEDESAHHVSFAARSYPLLEMLRAAKAAGKDVMWGV